MELINTFASFATETGELKIRFRQINSTNKTRLTGALEKNIQWIWSVGANNDA